MESSRHVEYVLSTSANKSYNLICSKILPVMARSRVWKSKEKLVGFSEAKDNVLRKKDLNRVSLFSNLDCRAACLVSLGKGDPSLGFAMPFRIFNVTLLASLKVSVFRFDQEAS